MYQGNSLRTLVRMLRARDSKLKLTVIEIAERQPFIRIKHTAAQERNHQARHAFEALGAQAKSAVPAIIEVANRNVSPTSALDAIDSLGFIGPSAAEAVPSLLRWATNADAQFRCDALFALGRIRSEPDRVVPALTNALVDPDPAVRVFALIALEEFGPEAKAAVPVLVEYQKSDTTTRSSSALKAIDSEAAGKAGVK